jgi:hypothetical protein
VQIQPEEGENQANAAEGEEPVDGEGTEQNGGKKKQLKKKWGPVVAKKKSSRLMNDNRTIQEKATEIKKVRNLEDNYPTKKGMKHKPPKTSNSAVNTVIARSVDIVIGDSDIDASGGEDGDPTPVPIDTRSSPPENRTTLDPKILEVSSGPEGVDCNMKST